MEYRLSYGNGQCLPCPTYEHAARELLAIKSDLYVSAARIQRYEGAGDWVVVARIVDGEVKRLPPTKQLLVL